MIQGITGYSDVASAIPKSYQGVANEWYVNRNPLTTRLPKAPVGSPKFSMVGHRFRNRTARVNGGLDGSATTAIFDDATNLMVGDVLYNETTGETLEVTGSPTSGTTVAIRRGVGGTTAQAIADDEALSLIGNSRTGSEVNQLAISQAPVLADQYVQTFQHVVQVGDILEDSIEYAGVPGKATPFARNRMDALQNLMDDVEYSSLYGIGEDPAVAPTGRGKQHGIRSILTSNRVLNPTAKNAYKPSDFVADAFEPIFRAGGNPTVMLCSTDWMTGLSLWGLPYQRLDQGETRYGARITAFTAPFLGDIAIIPCPMLKPKTTVVLSADEARFRVMRPVTYAPYGRRGDATEGDWIARMAIEIENEDHHAWIEGIVAFAP